MSDVVRDRIAKIAARFDGLNAVQMGRAMVAARNTLDGIKAEAAEAEATFEFLRCRLPEVAAGEGVTKLTVSDGEEERRIRFQEEIYVSATQESGAAERVVAVLKNSGNGGMVKETVAPGTLKAFVGRLRKASEGEDAVIDPVFKELLDAGMTVKAIEMARFY
jgi:hypothetical protein